MLNLSASQKKIVQQDVGSSIQVLASAGTGKTRVLTERVRYILENTKKEGVIALTFTNKAAQEMQIRLKNSDKAVSHCWIATIHSVAQRIVEQYSYTIGIPSELNIYDREQDRDTIFLQALSHNSISLDSLQLNNSDFKNKNNKRTIKTYMDLFSKIKRELLIKDEIKKQYGDDFLSVFQSYQEELKNSGGIDFDDILVYAHRILIEQPRCAEIYGTKYKYICVDEAQDLNKAQYELIKALYSGGMKSVMMVGDPNQMIYGFNGSSKKYLYTCFINDFSPAKFQLKENYRSSKAVVRLANRLKPGSQKESDFALEGRYKIYNFETEEMEAKWVCEKIKKILNKKNHFNNTSDIEGPVSLNNIVVIARNRFVFQELEKILKNNKMNYSFKKSKPLWEPISRFGKVLDLSIRLKINPQDWISAKKLWELLNINISDKSDNRPILKSVLDHLSGSDILSSNLYKTTLETVQVVNIEDPNMPKLFKKITDALNELVKHNNYPEELEITEKELELSMQDLTELQKHWTLFRRTKAEKSLWAFKNSMALGELFATDSATNRPLLTLSTVHTMKGLEKDIVFLIGMCEGVFPDYRAQSPREIEEEKNNAFVAVTRARRWIYITYPKNRKMPWGDIKAQQTSQFVTAMKSRVPYKLDIA